MSYKANYDLTQDAVFVASVKGTAFDESLEILQTENVSTETHARRRAYAFEILERDEEAIRVLISACAVDPPPGNLEPLTPEYDNYIYERVETVFNACARVIPE